jgi:hypothetical protein
MTKMIDRIYLDMDGVISDFMSKYREVNGEWKLDQEGKKSDAWRNFCENGYFAQLNPWPGGRMLMNYLDYIRGDIPLEILTSTGGPDYHNKVTADKRLWCHLQGITYKVNTVPGRWLKKEWATPTALLIDDTADVIDAWRAAGGVGILHVNLQDTVTQLNAIFTQQTA